MSPAGQMGSTIISRVKIQDGDETKIALIEAAEHLFALHGIDGVSLRQIGAEAGSLNTNVVGYHFGGKEALVEAIYHHRLPALDARRRELLDAADRRGDGQDITALLDVMWRPLFEQTSPRNHHSYARFLASISRDGLNATRMMLDPLYPATHEASERLSAATGPHSAGLEDLRMRMQAFMIYGALEYIDETCPNDAAQSARIFEETLRMAVQALAPSPAN